jgi:hypothetical protein
MEEKMVDLLKDTKRRIVVALAHEKAGKDLIDALERAGFEAIEQPVGIKDPDNVSLSVDDANRKLTVAPISGSFTYYVAGKEIEISVPLTATWPDQHGLNFFYLDENASLQISPTFSEDIITKYSFVSIVLWDYDLQKHIYFANEKHGIHMSDVTHLYLHRTRGAAFDNGLKLVGFNVDGNGSLDSEAKFTSNSGQIWDEDIKIPIPAQSQFPIFYKLQSNTWKRKDADNFPLIYNGTAGYTGATAPYNYFDGLVWSLQPVTSNKFFLVHYFGTNDIEFPIIGILGQQQYDTKSEARAGAVSEIKTIKDLPVAEFAPLGSVIFQTNSTYVNTVKAKIVSTDLGDDYEDHRTESVRPGSLA